MEKELIILIVFAVVLLIVFFSLLFTGRLKKILIKLGKEGVELDAELGNDSNQPKEEETGPSDQETIFEGVKQSGHRNRLKAHGDRKIIRDVEQSGDDNEMKIGKS